MGTLFTVLVLELKLVAYAVVYSLCKLSLTNIQWSLQNKQ